MNSFGRIFKVNIFGESHGESVGVCIDGMPAGLPLTVEDFLEDIERRKGGTQKGTTPRQESDLPIFKSGIFNNKTTGAPLTILFENNNNLVYLANSLLLRVIVASKPSIIMYACIKYR